MKEGRLTLPEHVEQGIERFPDALLMLFSGGHMGKLLVAP
jgi:NADPH-dependent curcumin reductase CurA